MAELKTDVLTKLKQYLISIPNGEHLFATHYEELFSVSDFEIFLVKLNKIKWRMRANPLVPQNIKDQITLMIKQCINLAVSDDTTAKKEIEAKNLINSPDTQSQISVEYCEHTNVPLYNALLKATPQQLEVIHDIIHNSFHKTSDDGVVSYDDSDFDVEFDANELTQECQADIVSVLNCK
ncbi:hypothetical protein EIN_016100 [Entamoeba invadens IP1]|uniref:hypothetical protein n=1 Tax=Entamoeba invadens IP1 TaxID=370355 RepID=UPI0002C3F669|nr:hypothetical protein EIN_016100 [Entamoeba invadens IP1]ELP90401.1 hypothetical protein EIN_016100 [Entamoeba invadens IP1]|eukprot:XP_004257172.1 hypothetical protein EIN_016100 [Entamoeba invadens IP1]